MKYVLLSLFLVGSVFAQQENYVLQPESTVAARYAFQTNANGQAYHWASNYPISVAFDSNVPDFAVNAVTNSFKQWNAQIENLLTFDFQAQPAPGQNPSLANIVIQWNTTNNSFDNRIAETILKSADGIHITTIVIIFYAVSYDFHSGFPYGSFSGVLGTSKGTADIEGVALHECGHAMGLAHSTVISNGETPTMYPVAGKQSYYLHLDDIKGIRAAYNVSIQDASKTDEEKVLDTFDSVNIPYAVALNKKITRPQSTVGIFDTITVGKEIFIFNPTTKEYVCLVVGNKAIQRIFP